MTGRPIEAAEAERWGLVNRVVPDDELRGAAMSVAATVAAAGRDAVVLSKQVVRHGAQVDRRTQLHHESAVNGLCFHSAEFLARQRAFRARALGRAGA